MRISRKQREEIEFLTQISGSLPFEPTDKEVEEYILHTVMGVKNPNSGTQWGKKSNRIFLAKRYWDITLKMYQADLKREPVALIFKEEILEWYSHHPYIQKVVSKLSYV